MVYHCRPLALDRRVVFFWVAASWRVLSPRIASEVPFKEVILWTHRSHSFVSTIVNCKLLNCKSQWGKYNSEVFPKQDPFIGSNSAYPLSRLKDWLWTSRTNTADGPRNWKRNSSPNSLSHYDSIGSELMTFSIRCHWSSVWKSFCPKESMVPHSLQWYGKSQWYIIYDLCDTRYSFHLRPVAGEGPVEFDLSWCALSNVSLARHIYSRI